MPTRRLAFLAFFVLVVSNWLGAMILAITKAMKAVSLRLGSLRGSSYRINSMMNFVKAESPIAAWKQARRRGIRMIRRDIYICTL